MQFLEIKGEGEVFFRRRPNESRAINRRPKTEGTINVFLKVNEIDWVVDCVQRYPMSDVPDKEHSQNMKRIENLFLSPSIYLVNGWEN